MNRKLFKGILLGLILLYAVSGRGKADTSNTSISRAKQLQLTEAKAIDAKGDLIKSDDVTIAQVKENYGNIPLYFIRNDGQIGEKVKYYEKGNGHSTYFTKDGVYLGLTYTDPPATSSTSGHQDNLVNNQALYAPDHTIRYVSGGEDDNSQSQIPSRKSQMIKLTPLGANKDPEIVAENKQKGKVNYLLGSNPEKWKTNIPTYRSVTYKEIYDGVDMKFYGNNRQMEYDIIVKPGADPSKVIFLYDGIKGLRITEDGKLEIDIKDGKIIQNKPYCYQETNGKKVEIATNFKLINQNPETRNPKQFAYTFELSSYDDKYALIIDPTLVYSSFFGGSGPSSSPESVNGIAVDASGGVYLAGQTNAQDFETTSGAFDEDFSNNPSGVLDDAFVSKFTFNENTMTLSLEYSTFLGGVYTDLARDIAVDTNGCTYITGETKSPNLSHAPSEDNFPITGSAFDQTLGNINYTDAFVAKLNASGSNLIYSTYLGGDNHSDIGYCITVDTSGSAYVAGITTGGFPTTGAAFDQSFNNGTYDGFVIKLDVSGSNLVYSTYLGGSSADYIRDIVLDNSGNAYVTGSTGSDFPTTTGAYDETGGGAFVTKLNALGSSLVFSTFLGNGSANGIAIDTSRNVYVTGDTSGNFPMAGSPYDSTHNGNTDIFIAKLNSSGSNLEYSTYLGSNEPESGNSIALDNSRSIFISGVTESNNMPLVSPLDSGSTDGERGYFAQLDRIDLTGSSSLLFASYFGQPLDPKYTKIESMVVDASGDMHIAGRTRDNDNHLLENAYDDVFDDYSEGFFAKIGFGLSGNPPVADAGDDQANRNVNDVVSLDGTDSYDPDNDPLTYDWFFTSKPAGSTAILSNPTSDKPSFMIDFEGTYDLHLVVFDGNLYSESDEVSITTFPAAHAVWVDFNYSGTENGTFDEPYDTLGEGVAAVPAGGNIIIKAGSTSETLTITKAMTISAYGGAATIGAL